MCQEEKEVRECDPCPAPLDEKDIEDIRLLCEIRGCGVGIMRLCDVVVRRIAGRRIEERVQRAEEESHRVDC